MTYASLLVAVEEGAESDSRLELACDLANAFDAHVSGAFAGRAEPPLYEMALGAPALADILAAHLSRAEADMSRAKAGFDAIVKDRDVRADWSGKMGTPSEVFIHAARSADLLVIGSRNPLTPHSAPDVADLVMSSGRPVLVVPPTWAHGPIGEHALIAWKDCREARLALASALPLLQHARDVTLFRVGRAMEGESSESDQADLVRYLARHRIAAEIVIAAPSELPVGRQILREAASRTSGLIVAGGYGNSRLREWALGGVTRALLHDSDICLCLAH